MILSAAQQWVLRNVRDRSAEADQDVDRAIQLAGNEWCRITRGVRSAGEVAIASGDATFDTSALEDFTPEQLLDVVLVGKERPLSIVGYPDLNSLQAEGISEYDYPSHLAFLDSTGDAGELWPEPTEAYTAKVRWWRSFTTWTPGAGEPTLELNIPDRYLQRVLVDGACGILKAPSEEEAFGTVAWQKFQQYCASCTGVGHFGARSYQTRPASDFRRRPRRIRYESY